MILAFPAPEALLVGTDGKPEIRSSLSKIQSGFDGIKDARQAFCHELLSRTCSLLLCVSAVCVYACVCVLTPNKHLPSAAKKNRNKQSFWAESHYVVTADLKLRD